MSSPANPARRRLRATTAPTEPARGVAPISATDRGLKSLSRLRTDIAAIGWSSFDPQCRSLLNRRTGPTLGELVDPVGDQAILYLCHAQIPNVVDQIAPGIVQPAGAGDNGDDATYFQLIGMHHPTANQQCCYNLEMAANGHQKIH